MSIKDLDLLPPDYSWYVERHQWDNLAVDRVQWTIFGNVGSYSVATFNFRDPVPEALRSIWIPSVSKHVALLSHVDRKLLEKALGPNDMQRALSFLEIWPPSTTKSPYLDRPTTMSELLDESDESDEVNDKI